MLNGRLVVAEIKNKLKRFSFSSVTPIPFRVLRLHSYNTKSDYGSAKSSALLSYGNAISGDLLPKV